MLSSPFVPPWSRLLLREEARAAKGSQGWVASTTEGATHHRVLRSF